VQKRADHSEARPGVVLNGRYELRAELGRRPQVEVFDARDLNLERRVVIKIFSLLDALQDKRTRQARLERFRHEVRCAAQVEHDHWSRIYDMGLSPEIRQPYLVAELLTGHTLEVELQRNGRMSPQRAMFLLGPCMKALEMAHQKGFVHRDVTPESLFLVRPGEPDEKLVVIDYGLAHCLADEAYVQRRGAYPGAPAYMPPEYVQSRAFSPASDVYQLALTLVEMLTGQRVVDARHSVQCLIRNAHGDFSLPKALVNSSLGAPIARALLLAPELRTPDAGALSRALSRVHWEVLPSLELNGPRVAMADVARSLLLEPDAALVEDLGPLVELADEAGLMEAAGDRTVILKTRTVKRVRVRAAVLGDDVMLRVHKLGGDPLDPYQLPLSPHLGLYKFETELELAEGSDEQPVLTGLSLAGLDGAVLVEVEPLALYPSARDLPWPSSVRGVFQVTDLGVALFVAPDMTIVRVSRLSDGEPVEGCTVAMWLPGGDSRSLGKTDPDGILSSPSLRIGPEFEGTAIFLITSPDWEDRVALPLRAEQLRQMQQSSDFEQVLGRLLCESGVHRPGRVVKLVGR